MTSLFVYGTLKRGDLRSKHLLGQMYLGDASTEPRYRLYDCGTFPGMIEVASGGVSVQGEVYDVSAECLRQLDDVEGVEEGLYARRTVRLVEGFADRPVEAYFYQPPVTGLRNLGERWTPRE